MATEPVFEGSRVMTKLTEVRKETRRNISNGKKYDLLSNRANEWNVVQEAILATSFPLLEKWPPYKE